VTPDTNTAKAVMPRGTLYLTYVNIEKVNTAACTTIPGGDKDTATVTLKDLISCIVIFDVDIPDCYKVFMIDIQCSMPA